MLFSETNTKKLSVVSHSPLVIFHKQIGDVLLLEPALAKLSAATGNTVTLSTRSAFAPMVSLMENVEPDSGIKFRSASEVISFSGKIHPALKTLATCAPKKSLYLSSKRLARVWHPLIFTNTYFVDGGWDKYRAEHFFNIMPCDSAIAFRPPVLKTPPAQWQPGGLPSEYVVVHATSAWQNKSWPADSWAKTLTLLGEKGVGPFILTGGPAEWERKFVREIEVSTRAPVLNLCGQTSMSGYLAVVANSSLVLCIDGSATHLAAAFKRKSVTLFGPTNSTSWHATTERSRLIDARALTNGISNLLSEISPALVTATALELIEA